jgi:DNA-directed RNA polymerase specialized sigma24 family protein
MEAVYYVQPSTHGPLHPGLLCLRPCSRGRSSCHQSSPLIGNWCSMSSPEVPLWWDRDVDRLGRRIRPDVRAAAHGIWDCACKRTRSLTSDGSDVADLMEKTVAQVSRYLDRGGVAEFSRDINGLLMVAFQKALQRHVAKLRRIETFGGTAELSNWAVDRTWTRQVQAHLELDQIVRKLCERSRTVLALRYAGCTWKEAARILGTSVPALRSAFWRDVDRVKKELSSHRFVTHEHRAQQDLATTNDPPC